MDVAGEGEQLGLFDHLDGFLSHRLGGGLQVQLLQHRDDEHIIFLAGPLSHQSLAYAGRVLVNEGGHAGAIHRPVGVGVVVGV